MRRIGQAIILDSAVEHGLVSPSTFSLQQGFIGRLAAAGHSDHHGGQIVFAFPILMAMRHSAQHAANKRAWESVRAFGADSHLRTFHTVVHEARFGLMATHDPQHLALLVYCYQRLYDGQLLAPDQLKVMPMPHRQSPLIMMTTA